MGASKLGNYGPDFTQQWQSDFSVTGETIFYKDNYMANSVGITKVFYDIATQKLRYELSYKFEDRVQHINIKPVDIDFPNIRTLSEYGIEFDVKYAKELSRYLNFQRTIIKSFPFTTQLGWIENENGTGTVKYLGGGDDTVLGYQGDLDIKSKGDLVSWKHGIKSLVLGNVELELVLVVALSTVLVGYDALVLHKDIGSALINLSGDSSTGKSTAAMLAISCFGNPVLTSKGSLMRSFSSTSNSKVKLLSNLNGVMVCFDDLSSSPISDISELIYTIGNGREKDRMIDAIDVSEGGSFTTQVLVTGEESLINKVKKTGGASIRYVEFEGLHYTKNAAHSEDIKKLVKSNYGLAATHFASYLPEIEVEKLKVRLESHETIIRERFNTDISKVDRYIKRFSMFTLTAELLEESFGFQLDKSGIAEIFINTINSQLKLIDYGNNVFQEVISWVLTKRNNFIMKGEASHDKGEYYGYIVNDDEKPSQNGVCILESQFNSLLIDMKLPDSKVLIQHWKKMGLVKTETGRLHYRDSKKNKYIYLLSSQVI